MAYFCSFILHVCTVYLNKLNLKQSSGIYYGDFCVIIVVVVVVVVLSFHFSFVDRTSN